jgi:hypothetical protein
VRRLLVHLVAHGPIGLAPGEGERDEADDARPRQEGPPPGCSRTPATRRSAGARWRPARITLAWLDRESWRRSTTRRSGR